MTTRYICKMDGCDGEVVVKKRMLCRSHYNKFTQENRKKRKEKCSLSDCDGFLYAKGYCRKHHSKWLTYGVPYTPEKPEKEPVPCKKEDCDEEARARGFCANHYYKWYRQNMFGADSEPRVIKKTVGYAGAHARIKRARGYASDYECADCPDQARDWTLRHDATDVLIQQTGRMAGAKYSLDVYDYVPRCEDCHKAYDAQYENRQTYYPFKGGNK